MGIIQVQMSLCKGYRVAHFYRQSVEFERYFKLMKVYGFTGPISMHFEYDLGGAQGGKRKLNIPPKKVVDAMAKDLKMMKQLIKESEL